MTQTLATGTNRDRLRHAVTQFNQIHDRWVADPNQSSPTLEYWDALEECVATFYSLDIPADMRELNLAAMELQDSYEQLAADNRHASPPDYFWHARQKLADVLSRDSRRYRPQRESVKSLNDQKVPLWQIAKIWGLKKQDQWDIEAVQREIDQPGSVITDDYVHPDDLRYDLEMEKRTAAYRDRVAAIQTDDTSEIEQQPSPPPESSHDLWLQKVPLRQASEKILKQNAQDVLQEWIKYERDRQSCRNDDTIHHPEITRSMLDDITQTASSKPAKKRKTSKAKAKDTSTDPKDDAIPIPDKQTLDSYEGWEISEIRELAEGVGITVSDDMNRDTLIAEIEYARAKTETPA